MAVLIVLSILQEVVWEDIPSRLKHNSHCSAGLSVWLFPIPTLLRFGMFLKDSKVADNWDTLSMEDYEFIFLKISFNARNLFGETTVTNHGNLQAHI